MDERRPQISPAFISLLSAKMWRGLTDYPLRFAELDGFFDPVVRNLAVDDLILLFAAGEGGAHGTFIVAEIGREPGRRVRVVKVQEFRKAPAKMEKVA